MKIDKFIVKEILEIGFDGIFFLEIIVLVCSLILKGRFF